MQHGVSQLDYQRVGLHAGDDEPHDGLPLVLHYLQEDAGSTGGHESPGEQGGAHVVREGRGGGEGSQWVRGSSREVQTVSEKINVDTNSIETKSTHCDGYCIDKMPEELSNDASGIPIVALNIRGDRRSTELKSGKYTEHRDGQVERREQPTPSMIVLLCDCPQWFNVSELLHVLERPTNTSSVAYILERLHRLLWKQDVSANLNEGDVSANLNEEDVSANLNEGDVSANPNDRDVSKGDVSLNSNYSSIQYFLDRECGKEERDLVLGTLLPFIATLALDIPSSKPFLGVASSPPALPDHRSYHPRFISSLLAHAFLSTLPSQALNLNIHLSNPSLDETHWKLRCLFAYFHDLRQGRMTGVTTYSREVGTAGDMDHLSHWIQSKVPLIPFKVREERGETDSECMHLLQCPKLSQGLIDTATPLNADAALRHPECLIPFLYMDGLGTEESIRVHISGPDNQDVNMSIIETPQIPGNSPDSTLAALRSFYIGMRLGRAKDDTRISVMRRPSVAAVTSYDSDPPSPDSSPMSLSLSDSCAHHHNSDSQLSYSLSMDVSRRNKGREKRPAPLGKTKAKKRESFADRLKAALERGNTPDSDDQCTGRRSTDRVTYGVKMVTVSSKMPTVGRRRNSIGFPTLAQESSDDFFTATEDEMSMEREPRRQTVVLSRRRMAQDMSRAMSSEAELSLGIPSVSSPLSSPRSSLASSLPAPSTSTSSLFSDSDSISSDGLGMPHLRDTYMEDLAEKLEGCLELEQGGLKFRDIELERAVRFLPTRCLSDTYLSSIDDLELFSHHQSSRAPSIRTQERFTNDKPQRSFSSVDLLTSPSYHSITTLHSTHSNVPTLNYTHSNVHTLHYNNSNMTTSYSTLSNVPTHQLNNSNLTPLHSTDSNVSVCDSTNSNVPPLYSVNSNIPPSHSTESNIPSPHSTESNIPPLHSTESNIPSPHSIDTNIPPLHSTKSNVPSNHSNDSNIPSLLSTNTNIPLLHSTDSSVPPLHSAIMQLPVLATAPTLETIPHLPLQVLLLWLAASVSGHPCLVYNTNTHPQLDRLHQVIQLLWTNNLTVGQLAELIFGILDAKEEDIFDQIIKMY